MRYPTRERQKEEGMQRVSLHTNPALSEPISPLKRDARPKHQIQSCSTLISEGGGGGEAEERGREEESREIGDKP